MAASIARIDEAVIIAGSRRSATISVRVASFPDGADRVTSEVTELVKPFSPARAEETGNAATSAVMIRRLAFMDDGTVVTLRGIFAATTGQGRRS